MNGDMGGLSLATMAIGGGSLAAIGAGAVLLLRRRQARPRIDTEAAAMDGAAAALPGFGPRAAVVGHDGAAALVGGDGDRLALVRAERRRLVAHAIDWGAVRATVAGIVVEGRKGAGVAIAGVDALDVRRLAPAASPEAMRIAERLAPPPERDIDDVRP
jgi:hypothetical protein